MAADIHEALVSDTHEVAEQFYYRHIEEATLEDAIKAIAELISYGGDLNVINHKMALEL